MNAFIVHVTFTRGGRPVELDCVVTTATDANAARRFALDWVRQQEGDDIADLKAERRVGKAVVAAPVVSVPTSRKRLTRKVEEVAHDLRIVRKHDHVGEARTLKHVGHCTCGWRVKDEDEAVVRQAFAIHLDRVSKRDRVIHAARTAQKRLTVRR